MSAQGSFKKMHTYESCAVMELNHPLADEKELEFSQITNENLITLPPKCIPFQKGNKFQEYLTLHAQEHIHIVSEGEAESILLAKCGYGIALLPGFLIDSQEGVAVIPVADTKNIDYGIYYRSKEKHIREFISTYERMTQTWK